MLSGLRQLAEMFDPPPLPAPVGRDPDDDAVLALAAASRADLVVWGHAQFVNQKRQPGKNKKEAGS